MCAHILNMKYSLLNCTFQITVIICWKFEKLLIQVYSHVKLTKASFIFHFVYYKLYTKHMRKNVSQLFLISPEFRKYPWEQKKKSRGRYSGRTHIVPWSIRPGFSTFRHVIKEADVASQAPHCCTTSKRNIYIFYKRVPSQAVHSDISCGYFLCWIHRAVDEIRASHDVVQLKDITTTNSPTGYTLVTNQDKGWVSEKGIDEERPIA